MSDAHKCDRCGALFEDAPRIVTQLTYCVDTDHRGNGNQFGSEDDGGLDLCVPCSEGFLAYLKHDDEEPKK